MSGSDSFRIFFARNFFKNIYSSAFRTLSHLILVLTFITSVFIKNLFPLKCSLIQEICAVCW